MLTSDTQVVQNKEVMYPKEFHMVSIPASYPVHGMPGSEEKTLTESVYENEQFVYVTFKLFKLYKDWQHVTVWQNGNMLQFRALLMETHDHSCAGFNFSGEDNVEVVRSCRLPDSVDKVASLTNYDDRVVVCLTKRQD